MSSTIKSESTINNNGLAYKVEITVPHDEVQRLLEKKYTQYGAKARIKGYRQGKIPKDVVKRTYGLAIRSQFTEELAESLEKELIEKNKFILASAPVRNCKVVEEDTAFIYNIAFDVMPVIPEYTLKGVAIHCLSPSVDDADVEDAFERLKRNCVDWVKVDRAPQDGDKLLINFSLDFVEEPCDAEDHDHEHDHSHSHNVPHELHGIWSATLAPTIKETILELQKGQKAVIKKADWDVWQAFMDGCEESFTLEDCEKMEAVSITVSEKHDKPFDATYWTMKGHRVETEEELKEALRNECVLQAKHIAEDINYKHVRPILISLVHFPLPQTMVGEELKRLQQYNDIGDTDIGKLAEDNVKLSLMLQKYAETHPIVLDERRLFDYLRVNSPMEGAYRDVYVNLVAQNKSMMHLSAMSVIERQLLDGVISEMTQTTETLPLRVLFEKEEH